MPRNYQDFVILKSDGIPTYHFAHVIDDHLMQSTHVVRGEEWISSLPIHIELFKDFGWEHPIYAHTATLMKMDGTSKRKLSKRKDPELALSYYQEEGISKEAVWEFLLTLLNSNFEDWRVENPKTSYKEFPFSIDKMSSSGALFNLDKLRDISKNVISVMSANEVYEKLLSWCKRYDEKYYELLTKYKERMLKALNIGRGGDKPRRDLETWKQALEFLSFYFDETFKIEDEMPIECDKELQKNFFKSYLETFNFDDDAPTWFEKVKELTSKFGFAQRPKDYKKNPENFKGSIVHITDMLRIALTGRVNAPDIWEVTHALGKELTIKRLEKWI